MSVTAAGLFAFFLSHCTLYTGIAKPKSGSVAPLLQRRNQVRRSGVFNSFFTFKKLKITKSPNFKFFRFLKTPIPQAKSPNFFSLV